MRTRRLLRLVLIVVALLLAASWGVSGALEYGWARRSLLARLSESFGRPVEAGRFSFSLLGGPQLEVDSVAVAEDPRFGQEYFLRADQLTVGLQWMALLRGRVEFGTLSLTHPSLNLVHTPDGHWNVESWLPPAPANVLASTNGPAATNGPAVASANLASTAPTLAAPRLAVRHLGRINIDDGRINFKLGQEKLLLALTDVSGQLDQDDSGRWSLDLQAIPMRASISLQQAGMLRLRGTVAGTSARLRPAALSLTWEGASLADALRLASEQDYGVRGLIGAEFTATIKENDDNEVQNDTSGKPQNLSSVRGAQSVGTATSGSSNSFSTASAAGEWDIASTLRFSEIHRWDLPARPTNPAVNINVTAGWSPGTPQLQLARCVVEAAHSKLVVVGNVDWSHGFDPKAQIASSSIDLADLLAWRRAFRANVPDDFTMVGLVGLQGALAAWPPRIEQATISSAGVDVHLASLASPIHVGTISAALRRDTLVLDPVSVTLPSLPAVLARGKPSGGAEDTIAPVGTLRVDGVLGPFHTGASPLDWHYRIAVSGKTERAQDLTLIASSLGHSGAPGWAVAGPAAFQLAWAGLLRHPEPSPTGTLDLDGLQLTTALLNQPVLLSSASVQLKPGQRHVKLGDAQAFGTHWKGTLDQHATEDPWRFDLSAGHLDIADLDLWLGPRARPGFLQRMMPFAYSAVPPTPEAMLRGMVTTGRVRVAELALVPLHVEKLDADVELNGPSLTVRRAQADFFEGRVVGDFEAQISAAPTYSFHGQFERVNLAALGMATSSLDNRIAGIAAGDIALAAHGIGREQLLASLAGQGNLQVRDAVLRGLDLMSAAAGPGDARVADPKTADLRAGATKAGETKTAAEGRFNSAVGSFRVGSGRIQVDHLSLAAREEHFEVQGNVSLARRLDLRVWSLPRGVEAVTDSNLQTDREEWTIGGTLEAPQLARQMNVAGNSEAAPSLTLGTAPGAVIPGSTATGTANSTARR